MYSGSLSVILSVWIFLTHTHTHTIRQVSLLVQSVGTDSVELVFSVGPMLAKTHTWIRHLGRAFRDFSVADTRTTDGPDSAVGHTSPPPVAGGGVAMSLCGRDNVCHPRLFYSVPTTMSPRSFFSLLG